MRRAGALTFTGAVLGLALSVLPSPDALGAGAGAAGASSVRVAPPGDVPRGLVTSVLRTDQSPFGFGANQGFWSASGGADSANDNYLVGSCCGTGRDLAEYRDFFTFDLSSLRGRVLSARLEFFRGDVSFPDRHVVGFFDVSTRPRALNDNVGVDQDVFADLGSGRSYGRLDVGSQSDKRFSVPLNDAAVRDMNAGRHYFSVGGRLLTLDLTKPYEQVVGGGTLGHVARLVVTTCGTG